MAFIPDARCIELATKAANGKLSEKQILDAFQSIADRRDRLQSQGHGADADGMLRRMGVEEAEARRIKAAQVRRQAALNVIVREKQLDAIRSQVSQGRTRAEALSASMLGTQTGVKYGRQSFLATESAYSDKYVDAGLLASLFRERPHLQRLMQDKALDNDVTREMNELRQGGKPGITGNSDAQFIAREALSHMELARTDHNQLGGDIGKLEGYFGPQNHDPDRLLSVTPRVWATRFLAHLDVDRTFPEVVEREQMLSILEGSYHKITTGFDPNVTSAAEKGQYVGPSQLGSSLSKERVYHFKSADDAIAYREEFGHGNTVDGILGHLRRMARINAAMKTFGPNPAIMFGHLKETLKRDIDADTSLSPQQAASQSKALDREWGILKYGLDVMVGAASKPDNLALATIMQEVRTAQSMSKLGSMIFSQAGDTVTPAIAAAFRGSNPFAAFTDQIGAIVQGRPKGEVADITYLLGEGLEGAQSRILNAHAAEDTRLGWLSKHSANFFKWNGSQWWTDVTRGAAVRTISAEMAMHAGRAAWDKLPARYAHFLSLHGIDAVKWDAIRQARTRVAAGKHYITPDRVNELPDSAVEPLIDAGKLAAARKAGDEQVARLHAQAKDDLVMTVRRLFADETNYAILQTDASSRYFVTGGTRPGTPVGEVMRALGQFRGFTAAFTQRVLGRAAYGMAPGTSLGKKLMNGHIGTLVGGLFIAGYISMTLKDVGKGNWPPRDITKGETIFAALLQSGAAGIYGDYLFAEFNRFGSSPTETMAGPTFGTIGDVLKIYTDAKKFGETGGEDPFSGTALFNLMVQNNPVWPLNLWYTRPVLDWLVLDTIREALNPGSIQRRARNRGKDYGQSQWFPARLGS